MHSTIRSEYYTHNKNERAECVEMSVRDIVYCMNMEIALADWATDAKTTTKQKNVSEM